MIGRREKIVFAINRVDADAVVGAGAGIIALNLRVGSLDYPDGCFFSVCASPEYQDRLCKRIHDVALDCPFQRPGAVCRIIAYANQMSASLIR